MKIVLVRSYLYKYIGLHILGVYTNWQYISTSVMTNGQNVWYTVIIWRHSFSSEKNQVIKFLVICSFVALYIYSLASDHTPSSDKVRLTRSGHFHLWWVTGVKEISWPLYHVKLTLTILFQNVTLATFHQLFVAHYDRSVLTEEDLPHLAVTLLWFSRIQNSQNVNF